MFSGTNLFHKNLYNQKNLKNLFYKRNDVNCFRLDKCDINKSVPAVIIDTFALASTAREAHFFRFIEVISTYGLCPSSTDNGRVPMTLFQ